MTEYVSAYKITPLSIAGLIKKLKRVLQLIDRFPDFYEI
jgi:hypothetical protein